MNKKIIILLGIFMLAGVMAIIVLPNGDKLLGDEDFSNVTDDQIQTYMENNLQMTKYKTLDEKIIVYYSIVYIEPTHVNNNYRVFTQEKPFIISIDLWDFCINKTTKQNCRDYLVDRQTPYYLIENDSVIREVTEYNNVSKEREVEVEDEFGNITLVNETYYELEPYQINRTFYEITNTTIESTYLRAYAEQERQFSRAIEFRNKTIVNRLEELGNLI